MTSPEWRTRHARPSVAARHGRRSLQPLGAEVAESGGARLLEGGPIAEEIRTAVAEDVSRFRATHGRPPALRVVIVGKDAPSTVYLERILRGCAKVGIDGGFVELEGAATESAVTTAV